MLNKGVEKQDTFIIEFKKLLRDSKIESLKPRL